MAILAPSFLIESISFLQVIRTTIKSGKSSKFGKIRSYTVELAALVVQKLGRYFFRFAQHPPHTRFNAVI